MEKPTVGVMAPGEMGAAVGRVLCQSGLRVITCLAGRGPRTAALAAAAGIEEVPDDATLVREAGVLLAILPPAAARALAERIATALRTTGAGLLYADCNAIAPRTTQEIGVLLTEAGGRYVDAGIIGGPPRPGTRGPRFYASGPHAAELACLGGYGLDVRVLGPRIGQASGLKMCYAALTKGLTALATEVLVAGQALGLDGPLAAELRASQGLLLDWITGQLPTMPPKAGRWVGEMEEIAATMGDVGLPPEILQGAAALYRFVQGTELGIETPEGRQRGQTTAEVAALLAAALPGAAATDRDAR